MMIQILCRLLRLTLRVTEQPFHPSHPTLCLSANSCTLEVRKLVFPKWCSKWHFQLCAFFGFWVEKKESVIFLMACYTSSHLWQRGICKPKILMTYLDDIVSFMSAFLLWEYLLSYLDYCHTFACSANLLQIFYNYSCRQTNMTIWWPNFGSQHKHLEPLKIIKMCIIEPNKDNSTSQFPYFENLG